MIYHKFIPSISGAIWGWTFWHRGVFWAVYPTYKNPEDALDALETFMIHKWTEPTP